MSDVVPDDETDDEWFDQLRDAVVSGADAPDPPEPPQQPASDSGPPGPALAGVAGVRDAVRSLAARMTAIESAVEDIAHVVRKASEGPGVGDLEVMLVRVLRAEIPALLEEHLASAVPTTQVELGAETLERWAEQADSGRGAPEDVVVLAAELRARVAQLEELQRQAFAQLADDRQGLIDDAVREIRTMLFGS